MAEANETIADIIAEMRALSNPISDGIIAINGRIIADRLEAANKRERGDCAKLREALDEIRVAAMSDYEWDADYLIEKCNAALAAPPRNCDVGTAEEQSVRMAEFCREQYKKTDGVRLCSGCRFFELAGTECQFAWAQLPYEKGGDK